MKLHGIFSPLQGISCVSEILSYRDIAEGSDAVFVGFDAIIIFVTLELLLLKLVNSEVTSIGPFSVRKNNTVSSVGYSALAFHYTNVRLLSELSLAGFKSSFDIRPLTAFRKIAELSVSFSIMPVRHIISVISFLACNKSGCYLTHVSREDDYRILSVKT